MTTTKRLSTQFTLAMLRAVYLTARVYLGLVAHFGRIAVVGLLVMTALAPAMWTKALLVLLVTLAHYLAIKALDAGYRRAAAAVARPAQHAPRAPVPPMPALKVKPRAAATVAKATKPAELRLTSLNLTNFNHLHA